MFKLFYEYIGSCSSVVVLRHQKGPASLQTLDFIGGDKRDRTADLLTASQALSQLSYAPIWCGYWDFVSHRQKLLYYIQAQKSTR